MHELIAVGNPRIGVHLYYAVVRNTLAGLDEVEVVVPLVGNPIPFNPNQKLISCLIVVTLIYCLLISL